MSLGLERVGVTAVSESGLPPSMVMGGGESCPWLPVVDQVHDFSITRRHGKDRGFAFYADALRYAQSQWLSGKPAQALLQLDKAFIADLGPGEHRWNELGDPYRALTWVLQQSDQRGAGFLGNPVRHFQHLASRMSGVRSEVRSWRAWVCMHLSERYLSDFGYPRDGDQLASEGLWLPSVGASVGAIAKLGWPGEAGVVADLLKL